MKLPDLDQLRHVVDVLERHREAFDTVFEQGRKAMAVFEQQQQALGQHLQAFEQQSQAIADAVDPEWLTQLAIERDKWSAELAAGTKYLNEIAHRARIHEERVERERARCKSMLAASSRCGRCRGSLSIRERRADDFDAVLGVSLVCDRCSHTKYPSPEYAVCEPADEFMNSALQLGGTPPFPASFNAYWACELYLRELGGSYYYANDDDDVGGDDGEFRAATRQHGLSKNLGCLPKPRRERLRAERCGDAAFSDLLNRLPDGLFGFLRYRDGLRRPGRTEKPELHIGEGGRLLVDGTDIYEILVQMGRTLQKFMKDEYGRNLHGLA